MTSPEDRAARRIDRWSGGCLAAAGLLLLPLVAHPDIFDSTFAYAALHTPLWTTIHACLVVAMILSLVALLGLYARRADRLGRLGAVGFALAVVGEVLGACACFWEAFLLPPIARVHPELFDWKGPVVTNWGVLSSGLGGLWVVGVCLLSVALWRRRVLPAAPVLSLAVSAAAFALFAGPFVPVLYPLTTVAFAACHVWVGAVLWSGYPVAVGSTQGSSRTLGARRSSSGSR